jgi:hypothetical protein
MKVDHNCEPYDIGRCFTQWFNKHWPPYVDESYAKFLFNAEKTLLAHYDNFKKLNHNPEASQLVDGLFRHLQSEASTYMQHQKARPPNP